MCACLSLKAPLLNAPTKTVGGGGNYLQQQTYKFAVVSEFLKSGSTSGFPYFNVIKYA
jgi:hypothetical protein